MPWKAAAAMLAAMNGEAAAAYAGTCLGPWACLGMPPE
eukprot:CAMPEP_0202893322 /NCGR_PEP_ID=MMETSP1392-20130828/2931_1 /ASSEMBLY_ACC=CAM_ASM_000868 /TAXON_ID=225041 /ORGANISM="Chlamydomonas chlamydogama, Strain SAG 11-48b" /LENGTH=37 /DNA_ID= /DNA_START= /DNA_END= /DNA_ORIENTATION=